MNNNQYSRSSKIQKICLLIILIIAFVSALFFIAPKFFAKFQAGFYIDERLVSLKEQNPRNQVPENINSISCEVVVVGGGTGGTAAAIHAARDGAYTCLIEETTWLGGMMTSAGVSSLDGHDWNYTGLVAEFVDQVKEKYKTNPRQNHLCLAPFCFEPRVGRDVLKEMTASEPNLHVYYNTKLKSVARTGNKITGIVATIMGQRDTLFKGQVIVEATELGDVLYLGNVPFDLGPENTNEPHSGRANDCVQPITTVAIIKDTGIPQKPINKPRSYDPSKYYCTLPNALCPKSTTEFRDWDFLMKYGQFPNGKIMINIPTHSYGNDNPVDLPEFDPLTRNEIINISKQNTLSLVYFIQTELKKNTYQIYNEFGTTDGLALTPYVRESRRLQGLSRITEGDLFPDEKTGETKFWKDAIAVGDYPLDIHSCERGSKDVFIPLPPFQVPYSALIPKTINGLIAAEKNISVSHIANGRTRLQPIVMSIGQAAGAAAALAVKDKVEPRNIDIKKLQQNLIAQKSRINFFRDVTPFHWAFPPISTLAQNEVIKGYGNNNFGTNNNLLRGELAAILIRTFHPAEKTLKSAGFTFKDIPAEAWFAEYAYGLPSELAMRIFSNRLFEPTKEVTRAETAEWIVKLLKLAMPDQEHAAPIYFFDLPQNHAYKKSVQILSANQIMQGTNGQVFPNKPLTRAEAATIIFRVKEMLK